MSDTEAEDAYPEVLIIRDTSPEGLDKLFRYVNGEGPMPDDATPMAFEEFTAIGRVEDCNCHLIECVCTLARQHQVGCQRRTAMTCAVPIHCDEHGFDVCPTCDPCTCSEAGVAVAAPVVGGKARKTVLIGLVIVAAIVVALILV